MLSIVVYTAISDLSGGKITLLQNEWPIKWPKRNDLTVVKDRYRLNPKLGSFEVHFKGLLLHSKHQSGQWPNR
jgi:hypothetical protein